MKTLMIGMDGVQRETFKRGWTPFLESLIAHGETLDLEEDIISRGWVEIFTGRHGTETGALYERPELDGSYRWTDKCSLPGIPGLGERVKPIWQQLNKRGYRVGVMNVPTTNPAPTVDGFFVSGGGGGRGVQQVVAEEQVYPHSVKATLDAMGYIVDERLGSLLDDKALYEPEGFFQRLAQMDALRCTAFSDLSRKFDVDLGFVANRSMVMAESFLLPELDRKQRGQIYNEELIEAGKRYYRKIDEAARKLRDEFPSSELILVSDHSTAARTHSVNFNAALKEKGYQRLAAGRSGVISALKKLRRRLPSSWVRRVKKNTSIAKGVRSVTRFDPGKSKAFMITHHQASHGIFLNDEHRFGGPVAVSEKPQLASQLLHAFNEHPVAKEHGMWAQIPEVPDGEFRDAYPDLYVRLPEGYTPSTEKADFVSEFEYRDEPIDLRTIRTKGERVSVKGHYPLAVVCGGQWCVAPSAGRKDLRLIYDHVLARFE
ncbi:hypothetical protein HC341_12305 [Aquisalimonas sp. 2447]|uniref:alkaline phosphatase family protein n=1 Tax=Aquisalimonas sp. 2447 TaxID=2740807 RepID=UPI0014326CDC|nr:alkaline phosphatase family protein [Aquisalimonas sp. 2447]QIT55917.1 hypothetical protein HC341_12305 [Aquisalimonas sp. 2447]